MKTSYFNTKTSKIEDHDLVAVYGSLRQDLHNHHFLLTSKFIGEFDTEPVYDLYSLGSYPALKENGSTSVKMEVYAIEKEVLHSLDRLEGYEEDCTDNYYNRIVIDSPYGECYTYVFNCGTNTAYKIESGDWKKHKMSFNDDKLLTARYGTE
jgi:gamma-glutamylcyclotransferase (GGCT)/AIG2-like uncharacterized protein YtfP